jgi:hypothetical protein
MAALPAAAVEFTSIEATTTVNGMLAFDQSVAGGAGSAQVNYTYDAGLGGKSQMRATVNVDAAQAKSNLRLGALASVTGAAATVVQVIAATAVDFTLAAPAGASFGGGRIAFHAVLEGEISGESSLALDAMTDLNTGKLDSNTASRTLSAPGQQRVEFDVTLFLDEAYPPPQVMEGTQRITLTAIASILPRTKSTASADGLDSARISGFRVFNKAGQQVTGFVMNAGGTYLPELVDSIPTASAIEFHHAGFDHYFVTAIPDEITKLDNGTFAGWARTGESFNVYTSAAAGLVPVCRFFTTAFGAKSSHFYAPRGLGCESTLANADWQFEGDVLFTPLPNAAGGCPAGTRPVYRLYNNGQGGAPNHRFTTSAALRTQMLAKGYIAEGNGIGVGMCSPQ